MPNRLADESSPYLLQHRDNPVEWYPWGDEAFELAEKLDKPVFVSIGYAACHWCHVMAHESFEDDDIASLMNELFVNVKVDREERPDVDTVYMNAIHIMGEGGGWPLSAFCTPKGEPYFLGTYFPPASKYGRPGFPEVLRTMAAVYREQRDKVDQNAAAVLDGLRRTDEHHRRRAQGGDVSSLKVDAIITSARMLAERTDPKHGGLGSKPKFPSSSAHDLFARAGRLKFGGPPKTAYLLQAERMAAGGIYDHIGGGFSRYSVDERWLVPHFEKMLYDNAQLLSIYGDAFAMTSEPRYREVIEETCEWLSREMRHESGGLYASQDADSEGEEGKYYVWRPEQIRDVLGLADSIVFCGAYPVTEAGNFDHAATVIERTAPRGSDADEAALRDMRERLRVARDGRIHPDTDDKILASWNGLALSGLCRAWAATGHVPALELARGVGDFLLRDMLQDDGRSLARVFKAGTTKLAGTVDDYAMVAHGLCALAEATLESRYFEAATRLLDAVVADFYEEQDGPSTELRKGVGVFYMTRQGGGDRLIYRPESHSDSATPAGSSVAIETMLRVGRLGDRADLGDIAERYLAGRIAQATEMPFVAARLLAALDEYLHGGELVVTEGEGHDELLTAARRAYAPTVAIAGPFAADSIRSGKQPGPEGKAVAYLCQGQSCSAPIGDPIELSRALTSA